MPAARWRLCLLATLVTLAMATTGCGLRSGQSAPAAQQAGTRGSGTPTAVLMPPPSGQARASRPVVSQPVPGRPGSLVGVLVPPPAVPTPLCPPVTMYRDGNAGPVFCSNAAIDASTLRYFTAYRHQGHGLQILTLAKKATQAQAISAICSDLSVVHATNALEYSAYLLAAVRADWDLPGISKVHGAMSTLCKK
jgi:hypothetical protein